jgi:hypothetical protein
MAIQRHRSTGEPPAATESWLQFIGNATVLLQWHGFTLLTDPNFVHAGEKVPIGYGLTTTRLRDPRPRDRGLAAHRPRPPLALPR